MYFDTIYYFLVILEYFIFFWVIKNDIKGDLTKIIKRPIILLVMFLFLVGVIVPILQYCVKYYRYQESYEGTTILIGNIVSLTSIIFSYLGYTLVRKKELYNHQIALPSKTFIYICFIVILIPAIYLSLRVKNQIYIIGEEQYYRDRISLGFGQGYHKAFVNNIYTIITLLYAYFLYSKNTKKDSYIFNVIGLGLFLYMVYYQIFIGNRHSLFILILVLVVITYKYKDRIKISKSFIQIILAIILAIGFSEWGKIRKEAAGQSFNHNTLEIMISGINGAFGNHENLLWLIENDYELYGGMTYLAAVTNIIPRSIWPNKPSGGGPALVNSIYPGKYVVGERGNSSITTGLNSEAFLNFSYLGIILVPYFSGVLLAKLQNLFSRANNITLITIYSLLIASFAVQIVYSEFLGLLARTGLTIIPIFIVYKLSQIRF